MALPATVEINLPGRILARSGFDTQVPGASLRLGEIAVTTDKKKFYVGNESNNPPWVPLNGGGPDTLDWSKIVLKLGELDTDVINGQSWADFINNIIIGNNGLFTQVITTAVTFTVYGSGARFPDLATAYSYLAGCYIAPSGSVTLQLASQQISITSTLNLEHPQGSRITIQGGTLKSALPNASDLTASGNTPSIILSDSGTNLTKFRNAFATELLFTNGAFLKNTGSVNFQDVLISSNLAASTSSGVVLNSGTVNFKRVAICGFFSAGVSGTNVNINGIEKFYCTGNGYNGMYLSRCSLTLSDTGGTSTCLGYFSSNGFNRTGSDQGSGLAIVNSSSILNAINVVCNYNNNTGIYLQTSSSAYFAGAGLVANNNSAVGIGLSGNCTMVTSSITVNSNGSNNVQVVAESYLYLIGATVTGGSYGVYASLNSVVVVTNATISGASTANTSPALNTQGNIGAWISTTAS